MLQQGGAKERGPLGCGTMGLGAGRQDGCHTHCDVNHILPGVSAALTRVAPPHSRAPSLPTAQGAASYARIPPMRTSFVSIGTTGGKALSKKA